MTPFRYGFFLLVADHFVSVFLNVFPGDSGESKEKNQSAAEKLAAIGARRGYTAAQLALAWVHSRGDFVFPIPGTVASAVGFLTARPLTGGQKTEQEFCPSVRPQFRELFTGISRSG